MPTLPQIYERIGSLASGGYLTEDSRYDKGYIYSLVDSARIVIAAERWKADMAIPPSYYQEYEPEFIKQAQNSDLCCSVFYDCPEIAAINNQTSGLGYVGTVDGKPTRFAEVASEAELSMILQDRITKIPLTPYVLRSAGVIRVFYKSVIKQFKMTGIFVNPREIPTFDIDKSPYPIDDGDLAKMDTYLMQGSMNATVKTIADRIANSKDNTRP